MDNFSLRKKEEGGIPVFTPCGYYDGDSGNIVNGAVEEYLQKGTVRIILDFSECKLINSPGIALLFALLRKTIFDFQGKVVFFGVDELKKKVFTMTGIVPLAELAGTLEAALEQVKTDS